MNIYYWNSRGEIDVFSDQKFLIIHFFYRRTINKGIETAKLDLILLNGRATKVKKNHKFIKITDCDYIQVNTMQVQTRCTKDAPTPIK